METPVENIVESCHVCGSQVINPEKCAKCGQSYCDEHTNKVDVKFCSQCMTEVVILDEKYTRTEEEWDENSESTVIHSQTCRVIKFQGQDWVWYGRKIRTLSDAELKSVLEYHRGMVYQIEQEMMYRKVQAQFKTPTYTITQNTTTETKKTKKAKVSGTPASPQDLAAKLKAMMSANGMDPSKLAELLGQKK